MFAWIHQAIPTEKENLLMLLKQCDKYGNSDREKFYKLQSHTFQFLQT